MRYFAYIDEKPQTSFIKNLFVNKKFKNHEIPDKINVYQLHHICYHDSRANMQHESHCVYEPFKLPKGMTREDGFKVLSYLTDFIENIGNIEECSLNSVATLDTVVDIERFGFERLNTNNRYPEAEIFNLFTIVGRTDRFKLSKYYDKYFDWYSSNVTKEEVIEIYQKIGLDFEDLKLKENKQLIKKK